MRRRFTRTSLGVVALSAVLIFLLAGCAGESQSTVAQEQVEAPPPVPPPPPEKPTVMEKPAEPKAPPEETRIAEAEAPPLPPPAQPPLPVPPPAWDVYFGFDRFAVGSQDKSLLEEAARLLTVEPGRQLLVEGHCDERGTVEYNLLLGERRAEAVKRQLEKLGVPASRIQVMSYGKERPVCTAHSVACWQKNRRAHLEAQ